MNLKSKIAAATVLGSLSLGMAVPAMAHGNGSGSPMTAAERQAAEDARLTELATRLGITKDRIVQANRAQAVADVDRALAAGTINAAQAAAYKALIDASPGGAGKGPRVPHGPKSSATTAEQRKAEADARLSQYVARLGVTVAAYKDALAAQAKADIDKRVAAGTITAAQATAMKARIDANPDGGPGGPGRGPGGPGRGPGGRGAR